MLEELLSAAEAPYHDAVERLAADPALAVCIACLYCDYSIELVRVLAHAARGSTRSLGIIAFALRGV